MKRMSLKVRIFRHFPELISLLIFFFSKKSLCCARLPYLIFTTPKFQTLQFPNNSVILQRAKHVSGKFCWYVLEVAYLRLDLLPADVRRAIPRKDYDTLRESSWSGLARSNFGLNFIFFRIVSASNRISALILEGISFVFNSLI